MKVETRQVEFDHLDRFRVTHHIGSGLIEIESREYRSSFFGGKWYWKRIYLGHASPIEKAMKFYSESREIEKKQ